MNDRHLQKRFMLALLCVLLCVCMAGCSSRTAQETTGSAVQTLGMSDNEILTYTPIDVSQTPLVVGTVGNLALNEIWKAFERQNPDIQLIVLDITGGNSLQAPYVDWLANGQGPDVMFIASGSYADVDPTLYFQDLTTNAVVDLYQAESLNELSIDGRLYSVPGPSAIYGMYYNKILFEQYGWEYAATMDDFITLCQRIKADTNGEVQAWNPSAKYEQRFIPTLEAYQYTELFGGIDNYTWYNDLLAGKATYSEHMRPFFEMFQRMVDAGIITEDYFDYSASKRLQEVKDSKIAMVNFAISREAFTEMSESYEFGAFPASTGDGYLLSELNYVIALPVKEQTEKVAEASQRLLAFCSTAEAQHLYIDNAVMLSSLKDSSDVVTALPETVRQAIGTGHIFNALTFKRADQPTTYIPLASIRSQMLAIIKGETTIDGALAALDEEHQAVLDGTFKTELETVATASKDFTILETSEYFADKFRETTGADVALVINNMANCGNVMRIFAGNLTTAHVTTLLPRSIGKNTLVKASMTGQQLLDALSHPYLKTVQGESGVYAFSGLKCTVAPWHVPGQRIVSATMADGTAIDPAKTYTVAYWNGTVDPAYVTGEPEVYEGSFAQLLTGWLQADKTISPTTDGRMTLVWDQGTVE